MSQYDMLPYTQKGIFKRSRLVFIFHNPDFVPIQRLYLPLLLIMG